jgi:RNA-directed DNA polymerase
VDLLLKEGHGHVVDADIQSYFDTIPQDRLMEKVARKVADGRVLKLIKAYLSQGVMEGLALWTPTAGTPQGAVLSPLLANIYLDDLDHHMAKLGYEMVRYADDLVILCRTKEQAEAALAELRGWMAQEGLTLHPTKTRVVDAEQEGFDFLGYRFERGTKRPRDKSLKKYKDAIRSKTSRREGRSLFAIIADINRTARGWFEYFKHSHRHAFKALDKWTRMRLRSILRRRQGKRGRGRGSDHQRWPNAYFERAGLMNLTQARLRASQSPRG